MGHPVLSNNIVKLLDLVFAKHAETTRSSITQHGEITKSSTAEQICRV